MIRFLPLSLGLAALALCSAPAQAQVITWCVVATEAEEVPPTGSPAVAQGTVTLDTATNTVSWNISHTGLQGTHTASHFHKGAIGQNGGIEVNIGTGNPIVGSAPITGTQATDLIAGLWYVNLHTTAFPGGEIRGQIDDVCSQTYCDEAQNPNNAADISIDTVDSSSSSINVTMSNGPPNQFVYLLVGNGTNVVNNPPGTKGSLCIVGGSCLGRYDKDVAAINAGGMYTIDLKNNLSTPCAGAVNIDPGATWNFQMWHRQPMGQPSTFSQAISVTFQ